MSTEQKQVTTTEAAKILGVSGATVRNWSKAGYITPSQSRPLLFMENEIFALQERIKTNRFNRLRKRANKSAITTMPRPELATPEVNAYLTSLGGWAANNQVRSSHIVYTAALRFLESLDEVALGNRSAEQAQPRELHWRRGSIGAVMTRWRERLGGYIHHAAGSELGSFLGWDDIEDRLGILHQSLSSIGKKSRTGAYFTPRDIIDASLDDLGMQPVTFLDPCCGTGRYLLRASKRFAIEPHNLLGFDSDPAAVDIASLNLLLEHPDWDFVPGIYCLDSLQDLANGAPNCRTNNLLGAIDAIATNPPWGSAKNLIRNSKNTIALIRSGESFSLFLEKSLRLLRPGGRLSFLLPESMLKIKAHADIRMVLLEHTSIRKITLLGRVFAGVFTPIVRLDLEKAPAPDGWMVEVVRNGIVHHAPQKRFNLNASHAFDVAVAPQDEKLLEKVYTVPHQTLRGQADWALGIVTGDNTRCVLTSREDDTEPVLRGRDIFKFAPRAPRCFIRFKPETFQQVAPERYFRAPEKLIYRFVSDRLVFAYDDKQLLTLNSANILIPRLPGLSMRAALAFLNSLVFQYIFVKRFRTRKILRGDLETLPFPLLDTDSTLLLERQVDKCMAGEYGPAEELDRMVNAIFGLQEHDVQTMRDSLETETVIL